MKRFALRAVLFALPILTLLILLEPLWERAFEGRTKDYVSAMERIAEGGPYSLIVFGDSHAARAIADDLLPSSVADASYGSDSFSDIYLKLRFLETEDSLPDAILLEVDANMFACYRTSSNNRGAVRRLVPIEHFAEVYGEAPSPLLARLQTRFPLLAKENRSSLALYGIEWLERTLLGRTEEQPVGAETSSTWARMTEAEKRTSAENRVRRQFRDRGADPMMIDAFVRVTSFCETRGVAVLGIRYPLSDIYDDLVGAERQAEIDRLLEHAGIRESLDLTRRFAGRDDLFLNQDHVTAEAANLLTEEILEVVLPALRDRSRSSTADLSEPRVGGHRQARLR